MPELKMSEEKFAQANYIITLYNEVHQLSLTYCNMINVYLELEQKEKTDQDNQTIKDLLLNIRFYSMQIYLKLNSLKNQLKIKDAQLNDLKIYYDGLKETYLIKSEKIELFLIAINEIMTDGLMQNLLSSSQETINNIYS